MTVVIQAAVASFFRRLQTCLPAFAHLFTSAEHLDRTARTLDFLLLGHSEIEREEEEERRMIR